MLDPYVCWAEGVLMEENVISIIKSSCNSIPSWTLTSRMVHHVVDALQGEAEIRCKTLVIQKSYVLIVVHSNKLSIKIGEVRMTLCGEICLSISSFWLWRVDNILCDGTHELVSNHVQLRLVLLWIEIVMALWFTVDENRNRVECLKISFTCGLNW